MPKHVTPLMDLYALPAIHQIEMETDGTRKNTENVHYYKDIFKKDCQNTKQYLFLQGEPGKGKTTFAAKLVLDWCNAYQSEVKQTDQPTSFNDIETLHKLKFVFLIALRDSRNQRKVTEMIKQQIIEMLYDDADDVNAVYKVLKTILETETCLVVQDGLDEWSDPEGKLVLPLLATPCTMFITTRPWKMSDERLKTSQIDCCFEIFGVESPFDLSRNIMKNIIADDLKTKHENFISYVYKSNHQDLIETPMLLGIIVSLWLDEAYLSGSACEIYSILLDNLLKHASSETAHFESYPFKCFKNTKYIKPNMEHVEEISKASFHLMFSVEKENSLVFSDTNLFRYLSESQKMFALKAGILTEKKLLTLSYRPSTYSFIHKSVQEFLAAIHIAHHLKLIDDVIVPYLNNNHNTCLDLSMVFKFLCGLSISAANQLSKYFDKTVQDSFQYLIVSGFLEAKANDVRDDEIRLHQTEFTFKPGCDKETLKRMFKINMSDVISIYWLINCNINLDFSSKPNLKKLCIYTDKYYTNETSLRNPPLHNIEILESIASSTVDGLDLSACKSLTEVYLGENITLLPNGLRGLIKLESIDLTCNCNGLELSTCKSIKQIDLGENVILSPNSLRDLNNLEIIKVRCISNRLDISGCHSLKYVDIGEQMKLNDENESRLREKMTLSIGEQMKLNDENESRYRENMTLNKLCMLRLTQKAISRSFRYSGNIVFKGLNRYSLYGLKRLETLSLNCICDDLYLFFCKSLKELTLGEQVSLSPDALNGLNNLETISLCCKCDTIDLSKLQSLKEISLGEQIVLFSNGLRGLIKLESIRLRCRIEPHLGEFCLRCYIRLFIKRQRQREIAIDEKVTLLQKSLHNVICHCDGLDLTECHSLTSIDLYEQVILLPNSLRDHKHLRNIHLSCKCDGLDLSGCNTLTHIDLGEQVILLPNSLRDLNNLKIIKLRCTCDGLDLSGCKSLKEINIGELVTLLPNACHDLHNLMSINMASKCEGLDLSECRKLQNITLGEEVTLLPNSLRDLYSLKKIKLRCKCDGLDLSGCKSLKEINIGEPVILLPNVCHDLHNLHNLMSINMACKCEGLDLSECQLLHEINLGEQVTLLPNSCRDLNKLTRISLNCICDGLDLSGCHSLRYIDVGEHVTLLPNALRDLNNLQKLKLICKYDGLDLHWCHGLNKINLGKNVSLLPKALCRLKRLYRISLECNCDGLDLSGCNSLEDIYLGEQVTLLPNALRGLNKLKKCRLLCKCNAMDLSTCRNLNYIELGEQITFLPKGLRGLNNLSGIFLRCKYDELNLSLCKDLRQIELGEYVTLVPNALTDLCNVVHIELRCKYDGLDLSSCHKLRSVDIGEQVIIVPNALQDISGLESIKLRCKYNGLDLSLSPNLKHADLGEQVTLVPNCVKKLCNSECILSVTLYHRILCQSVDLGTHPNT
ncbi:hypothetical protein DPMN_177318 [Dreissena polymorpha]|uniref:NACHT domain-containing protein n=1 Tax=Dreissena polymorpha TaxID=45954 RepID=A0A9D4ILH8_DREPO|nr:hypothetical protein DPMN_177318 [Dreissena polymorpha]